MHSSCWFRLHGSLILALLLLSSCAQPAGDGRSSALVAAPAAEAAPTGFARAERVLNFQFPDDHGPHPDYQTEWWYYTGNLYADGGRRFGFQLTFFRRALLPPQRMLDRQSNWSTEQVYMAHFALTDAVGGEFKAYERVARGAAGLAGAQARPYRVWLEDWYVVESPPGDAGCLNPVSTPCAQELYAGRDGVSIALRLADLRGPVLQGDRGLSRKGDQPGQASYYYSQTRLKTEGVVTIGDQKYEVQGWSWMDHEWSTSALSVEQVGWDWFSIQLDGGGELMLFQIRRADGSIDPYSSGIWVQPDGKTRFLNREQFMITVQDSWESPHTGAVYPAGWQIFASELELTINIQPLFADQELNLSYAYWEGAVTVQGSLNGESVVGSGYVELTGYSGSMGGEF